MGVNSYIFVNGVEIYKLKAKDSGINAPPLCLGNVPKGFSTDNLERNGLYRYVYDLSVNYNTIDAADTFEIHKYYMKKAQYKIMFGFIKKWF